jgi:acyl carrier protein
MEPREQIRTFVETLLRRKGDLSEFSDADSLLLSGRLDSLEVIELVEFMETQFGIDFAEVEFNRNDFESVSAMLTLLSKSQAA